MKKLAILLFATLFNVNAYSAYLKNVPVELRQPDGTMIECFVTGDEIHQRLYDKNNYTIVLNSETGYYVYAEKIGNAILPSSFVVGKTDPTTLPLRPNVEGESEADLDQTKLKSGQIVQDSPTKGNFNNLVISIRFDDQGSTKLTVSDYNEKFNDEIKPSLKSYFKDVSSAQLIATSHFFPKPENQTIIEFQDSHPRRYYSVYDPSYNTIGYKNKFEGEKRLQILFSNAIKLLEDQIVQSGINFDCNNDGYIDNIVFLMQGNVDCWASVMWPAASQLVYQTTFIGNKRVLNFNKQFTKRFDASVLCHEFFHSLGAPDLYRYNTTENYRPVDGWDIMAQNEMQHMTTYMKWKYGKWFSEIPEIKSSGTYTLYPVSKSPFSCYKIPSPFNDSEYFMVEYRRKEGTFESTLPVNYLEGLIVYRINVKVGGGNAAGPPDEVYIYRPGGNFMFNGDIAKAPLSTTNNRINFNDSSNPSCFLSNGDQGWIDLSVISVSGEEIKFSVNEVNKLPKPSEFQASLNNNQLTFSWKKPVPNGNTLIGYNIVDKNNAPLNTKAISDTIFISPFQGNQIKSTFKINASYTNGNSDFLSTTVYYSPDPSVRDSLALVALYEQCNGPGWIHNENWLKGPLSTWAGVRVTYEGNRVQMIQLIGEGENHFGLLNSLPKEIGFLTKLTTFDLCFSDLSGTFPKELFTLKNLDYLRIFCCQLSGEIPREIGNSKSLRNLMLDGNYFSGNLPDEITNLTELSGLYLGMNKFTGELPNGFWKLVNLQSLDLQVNNFSGSIPKEISNLSKLVLLQLSSNNFSGVLPKEIGQLNQLWDLYLNGNKFSGPLPDKLYRLTKLRHLSLSGNKFSGGISPAIGTLSNLESLELHHNEFSGNLPIEIGNLTKMKDSFRLDHNFFTGSLPKGIADFDNINYLAVGDNKFEALPSLAHLTNLKGVQLDGNKFTFEDLEPNRNIAFPKDAYGITYAAQAYIGKQDTIYTPINKPYTVSIYCGGENNQYQWFRDGIAIAEKKSTSQLTISSITQGNNGSYTCKVTNTVISDLVIYSNPIVVFGENILSANAGIDTSVEEGNIVTLDGSASYNPKGNTLIYKWVAPEGITLTNSESQNPTFVTPLIEYDRSYVFRLTVSDGTNVSPTDEVAITVKKVKGLNQHPIANAGPDRTVNSGQIVSLYGQSSYDMDGNKLQYRWIAPDGIILSAANIANPTFVAPEVLQDTQFTFNLVVNDGIADSQQDQIIVSVIKGWNGCLDDAKSTEIPNMDALGDRKGQSFTAQHTGVLERIGLTVWKTSIDPYLILREWVSDEYEHAFDGQIIATSNVALEKRATNWDQNSYQEMWNFLFPSQPKLNIGQKYVFECLDPGRCGLNINEKGNYNRGRSYTQNSTPESDMQFEIHMCSAINDFPISNCGPNQSVFEGTIVTLDGFSSYDPNNDSITYNWTAPAEITLSFTTVAKPTFTAPEVSENANYTFSLVVNDGMVDSPVDQVVITVKNVNKPPVAIAGNDQSVNEGATVTLDGSVSSDSDGSTITYKWTVPVGITLNSTNTAKPTFIAPEVTTNTNYTFSLVVNDGMVDSPVDQVVISVKNINKPPVANAGADQTANEGALVSLDGSASSDTDLDNLIYTWTAPAKVLLSNSKSVKPSFVAPEVKKDSILSISLIVNDGKVNSSPSTVKVTVLNVVKVENSEISFPGFEVFPNPTTGIVTIEFSQNTDKETTVSVLNMLGAEIFRKELKDETKLLIDLTNQIAGIYVLKVTTDNQQYISKIILRK